MTGGQDSQGTGKLEDICLGLGASPSIMRTIDSHPRNHDEMVALFRTEFDHNGLSVIVSRRECIQTAKDTPKEQMTTTKPNILPTKTDIILAGVGGQRNPLHSSHTGRAALNENLYIKQAEVHGMSQRGGDVQSNLRISDRPVASDLIPLGQADLIISLEPMEALRYVEYLGPEGRIVTNTTPFVNIPNYPDLEAMIADLHGRHNVVAFDVRQACPRKSFTKGIQHGTPGCSFAIRMPGGGKNPPGHSRCVHPKGRGNNRNEHQSLQCRKKIYVEPQQLTYRR